VQKGNMPAKEPRLDEFTAKAVRDPKNPGEVLLVTGFLGASSEPKHTRIYWDASLGTYVDVKTTDISHTEPLPKEQSPLGGSYIWLKRDAEVYFGAGGQSAKGKFFEGPLMAAYGGQFGALGGGGAGVPAAQALAVAGIRSVVAMCPISNICHTFGSGCESVHNCPTGVGCPISHFCGGPGGAAQQFWSVAGCGGPSAACPSFHAHGCGSVAIHGCGSILPPCIPQLQAQMAGTHGVQCWVSYGACNTYHYPCASVGGGCGSVGAVCPIR